MNKDTALARIWAFYRDGFRSMTVGRTLWILIAIKLFIMFAILKVFFFPGFLRQYDDAEGGRENYVRRQLIERTDNQL
jgi:cbb3-type cytochrome oxidase maturation protein